MPQSPTHVELMYDGHTKTYKIREVRMHRAHKAAKCHYVHINSRAY